MFWQFLPPLLAFPSLSLDSTFATRGYIASTSTQCLRVYLRIVCGVYLCTGIIPSVLQAGLVGKCLAAMSLALCLCLQTPFRSLALKHLLPLTWLMASFLDLCFHFSVRETLGYGFGWLFSTWPLSINLALESKVYSPTSDASLSGWACLFPMQGYLFAWCAHKEINVTCRTAEAGRRKGSSLGQSSL